MYKNLQWIASVITIDNEKDVSSGQLKNGNAYMLTAQVSF